MFSNVFGTQPQGKNWTACEKGQTHPYAVAVYVEVLLLAMSPKRCQPLVHCYWDEINLDQYCLTLEYSAATKNLVVRVHSVHVHVSVGGMHYVMFIMSEGLNLAWI